MTSEYLEAAEVVAALERAGKLAWGRRVGWKKTPPPWTQRRVRHCCRRSPCSSSSRWPRPWRRISRGGGCSGGPSPSSPPCPSPSSWALCRRHRPQRRWARTRAPSCSPAWGCPSGRYTGSGCAGSRLASSSPRPSATAPGLGPPGAAPRAPSAWPRSAASSPAASSSPSGSPSPQSGHRRRRPRRSWPARRLALGRAGHGCRLWCRPCLLLSDLGAEIDRSTRYL